MLIHVIFGQVPLGSVSLDQITQLRLNIFIFLLYHNYTTLSRPL